MNENYGYEQIANELEERKRECIHRLNAEIFRDGSTPHHYIEPPPEPWYHKRLMRGRRYLSVLWRALKGEDPFDGEDSYW